MFARTVVPEYDVTGRMRPVAGLPRFKRITWVLEGTPEISERDLVPNFGLWNQRVLSNFEEAKYDEQNDGSSPVLERYSDICVRMVTVVEERKQRKKVDFGLRSS